MPDRNRFAAILVVALVLVAAAAAAMKGKHWSPVDACLCPVDGGADAASSSAASAAWTTGRFTPLGGPVAAAAIDVPGGVHRSAGHAVTSAHARAGAADRMSADAWSTGRHLGRSYASDRTGLSASMGGLMTMLSLGSRGSAKETSGTSGHMRAASSGRHVGMPAPGAPATIVPSGGQQTTTVAGLLNGTGTAAPAPGSLASKGGMTASISGSAGLAATPEPASVLLLGTGLLGIAGVLRKRRH